MSTLIELLTLYRQKVNEHIKHKGRFLHYTIELTPLFLKEAEKRIIEGHKKYGEDWKTKNNLKEIDYEKLDIFNYTILDKCQKHIKLPNKNIKNDVC